MIYYAEYLDSVNDLAINDKRDINKSEFIKNMEKIGWTNFLIEHNIALLFTSHMWIANGVNKFANDKIVLVYSARRYGDKAMNLGGILHINKYSKTINKS